MSDECDCGTCMACVDKARRDEQAKSRRPVPEYDYESAVQQAMLFCGLLREMPLERILEDIGRAEATGPLFDPTLYMKARHKMEIIRRCVGALANAKALLPSAEEIAEAERLTRIELAARGG